MSTAETAELPANHASFTHRQRLIQLFDGALQYRLHASFSANAGDLPKGIAEDTLRVWAFTRNFECVETRHTADGLAPWINLEVRLGPGFIDGEIICINIREEA